MRLSPTRVAVDVLVGPGISVGVLVGVGVDALVAVDVGVGVDVLVGVGVGVDVDVLVGVGVAVGCTSNASELTHSGGEPSGGAPAPPSCSVPFHPLPESSVSVRPLPSDII